MDSRYAHHIRALPPAIRGMEELGFSEAECLQGTGLTSADLLDERMESRFTLEQEFAFHRRLLQLSGDPLLGLQLGKTYTLETYGLFGYAFLSAATLRQAMLVARNFGLLSFSLFEIQFEVQGTKATFAFAPSVPLPDDLLQYYADRDAAAVSLTGEFALGKKFPIDRVTLSHRHSEQRARYEAILDCPVEFNDTRTTVRFPAQILETPMPMRNAQTSSICQQQCQMLLARLSKQGGLSEEVRAMIGSRPGFFPDIDFGAEKHSTTTRTLRRRLKLENSSFQQLTNEVRYRLAREYLGNSTLPVEDISELLGYSTPGNFSAAFKRWHGKSPRHFRLDE